MRVRKLIWFEEIIEKLSRKHRVSQNEVRDILTQRPLVRFVEKGHRPGENVYAALGRTSAGRYVIVFFVRKRDGQAIILSARDMTKAERKHYEREKKN
ncbi:MAG: BrnT family toxin [Candidatus Bipolaricaulota bacterium]|nr:BrnT family toxin [Candidatus Bipolaricaulota bacterium]